MVSLLFAPSLSSSSVSSVSLQQSFKDARSSFPASGASSSASSSKASSNNGDEENVTITANRALPPLPSKSKSDKQKSSEDLRLLAISTHITEMSYSISDIQTRIFEIQELRHKSQSSGDTAGTTSIIDQSLMNLDERLESVAKGMKTIEDAILPISQITTPTASNHDIESSEEAMLLRKHAALLTEWEAVQDESETLREELKEDKWLTVFRTVTDQADGMMSSLEKAVNRCQDFIWQVHRRAPDESSLSVSSCSGDKSPLNFETFASLLESFEAKKKHYMPATSKVLSIIDKGVQDRVTKNGETLRRHADSAQRWKTLRDRIARTDKEMEAVRKMLLSIEQTPSEAESSTSGFTHSSVKHGFLTTPPNNTRPSQSRTASVSSTMSRSISPFRKFAQRLTRSGKSSTTPASKGKTTVPSSEPAPSLRVQRSLMFPFHGAAAPVTPERPRHKHSQSSTSESPLAGKKGELNGTTRSQTPFKQKWNSSTRVETETPSATVKGVTAPRRPSVTAADFLPDPPAANAHRHSPSRSSVASSRPWTPVNSSASTAPSNLSISPRRPPSRAARPPSRARTPNSAMPRPRPQTPSQIPVPSPRLWSTQSEQDWDEDEGPTSLMQRAFSPAFSSSGANTLASASTPPYTPKSERSHPPRPPSRSMLPVPSLQFSSASRPSSAMSNYSESPAGSSFRSSAMRAQTPESALRARVQHIPFYQGSGARTVTRPPLPHKTPPSSFREASRSTSSRPGSRAGAYTPFAQESVMHEYHPSNPNDPLDAEVAAVVNSIAHGLLIERVDPPLRTIPKEGEEIRAQYAFSNSLARKVVTCRLTTLTRLVRGAGQETSTKKVMCRVGGGWQDLQLYMLNRQAGL